MKVTLPKDLELYGVRHLAGTEVDIEPEVYNMIMQSILADRIIERANFDRKEQELLETAQKKRGRK